MFMLQIRKKEKNNTTTKTIRACVNVSVKNNNFVKCSVFVKYTICGLCIFHLSCIIFTI